jgi:hypothetical protein
MDESVLQNSNRFLPTAAPHQGSVMQIMYHKQPLISRGSLTITLPITGQVTQSDQRTFRRRIELIRKELGIFFTAPSFDSRTIRMAPTPPSRERIFAKHIRKILARLEVPAELGFGLDGDAA